MPHGHHIYAKVSGMVKTKCVHIHSQIMYYPTGNIYCGVIPNFQVLIFLTKRQMINIPKLDLQFNFTSIIKLRVLQHMEGFR